MLAIVHFNSQTISAAVVKTTNCTQASLFVDGKKIDLCQNGGSQSWLLEVTTTTDCNTIVPNCQSDFIAIGSSCYYFSNTTFNWHDSSTSCEFKGADLAHPNTLEKNTQLVNYLKTNFPKIDSWWLGASDLSQEGTWRWANDNSKVNFNNWLRGQPDNQNNEDCLHYWPKYNYGWNDNPCRSSSWYICEQKFSTVK